MSKIFFGIAMILQKLSTHLVPMLKIFWKIFNSNTVVPLNYFKLGK